eukprot:2941689-Amphidinium_carterae.1
MSSTTLHMMFKTMMMSTTLETNVRDHLSYKNMTVKGSKGAASTMEASGVSTGKIHVTAAGASSMRMIQLMTVIRRTN